MLIFIYDHSFEGLLTCIFDCFQRKITPADICPSTREIRHMFAERIEIISNSKKANRVWNGIQKKMTKQNSQMLYHAFLAGESGIEMKILRFAKRLFNTDFNIETDYGDADVLYLRQTSRKVKKEAMRMMQFVRFQRTKDDMYFSGIEPMYDVLPLIIDHFQKRFADQQWLLYDLKRNYGAFYNKTTVEEVVLSTSEINCKTGQVSQNILEEGDSIYQTLWKSYFKNINIKERKNLRLQRQQMPRRFWQYLPEKQVLK